MTGYSCDNVRGYFSKQMGLWKGGDTLLICSRKQKYRNTWRRMSAFLRNCEINELLAISLFKLEQLPMFYISTPAPICYNVLHVLLSCASC